MIARRALLVAIDDYPKIRPLDGCVNDSRLMRSVLVERFGFPEAHITQLLNAAATRQAILDAFDALAAATGHDDVVVIHYAGHGSQVRDREGDEPSGFDSTLMPWDTGREPDENRDITDDEIHLKLQALAARTSNIAVIVDACHSGTVTRDASGAKTRSVAPDLRPVSALPPSPVPSSRPPRGAAGGSGWLPLTQSYVLIAGCRDDEESKEYFPPEGGGPHGALTCFLCQALLNATATTTYRDVFDAAAARVNAYNPAQHPQLEGTADRAVFGVTDLTPAPFVRLTSRDGDAVQLAAGSTLGVTVGSTYDVHHADAKAPAAATALGEVVVRAVRPFDADAAITRESPAGAIVAGARAFETAHAFGDDALTVECVGADAEAAFGAALRASPRLRPVPAASAAAVRIHLLSPRSTVSAADAVPQAGPLEAPRWAVVDATGALVMPLKARGDETTVVQNLEKVARFTRTLALDNPAPGPLRGRVSVEVLTRTAAGDFVAAAPDADSGLPVVEEGQRVRFRITNHHDQPLFVAVVYLGTGCEITVPAHLQLAAGVSDGSLTGPVTFPPNYPFVDLGDALRGVDSVETVKLFVTDVRVDFSGLAQAGVRAFAPEPEPGALTTQGQWTTTARSFLVRRRAVVLGEAASGAAAPVAVGHAVIAAPAITATVSTGTTSDGRDDTAGFATAALTAALASADVAMAHTVAIDGARPTAASRGTDGPPPIAVTLPPPPEGFGQMVLASDELGVVSWSFAAPGPATRSADGRGAGRSYLLPGAVPDVPAGAPASRGVIGIVGRKIVKELVFPIVKPMLGQAGASAVHWLESTRWPYRVRTFTPDDYTAAEAPSIDRDGWARLGGGRALLMVHGTFSRSHLAFAGWPAEDVAALHRLYGGRVFAFDHLFLSEDPAANVRWLVSQMPDDADLTLDIVCHSRGGLVSRVLSEKQAEVSLGSRRLRIGKVVMVGVPNAGTPLADPAHVATLLDVFTNIANFLPDALGTPVLTMLVEFAKLAAIGALDNLAGLKAMLPGGDFSRWLNVAADIGDTRYFAVASDVVPTEPGLRHFIRSRALTALLKGGNDLIVPATGAHAGGGAAPFPVAEPLVLQGESAVAHTKYFADARVRRQVMAWLTTA